MENKAVSDQRSAVRDRHSALSYKSRATSHVSRRRSRMGFTLVELVLVIILIAILASIAVPRFVNLSRQADIAATRGALGAIRGAIVMDYASRTLVNRGVAKFSNVVYHSWFMEMDVPVNELTNVSRVANAGGTEGTPAAIAGEPGQLAEINLTAIGISAGNLLGRGFATTEAAGGTSLCCSAAPQNCTAETAPTVAWVYESSGDLEGLVKPCGDNSAAAGFLDDTADVW